jgi:hypothetical protein
MTNPSFILPSAPAYDEGILAGLNVYYDPTNFVASPMTVTRATTATRVNQDGLVELVPYNLLTYSEQFDNAAWVKSGLNTSGSYIDVTTAPNGTLTADLMAEDTANSQHNVRLSATLAGSQSHTYSFYAKSSGRINLQIGRFNSGVVPSFLHTFTIDGSGSSLGGNIENVGNGWYRCSGTFTTVGSGTGGFIIYLSDGASISYLGDGTSGAFIWGAQLVEGANALPYKRTETRLNIPRIDYSLGGCPSVLIEPQRTNLALWSEQFDNALWVKTALSVTENNAISPSGIMNADLITANGGTSQHSLLQTTGAGAKTYSVFAKMGTQRYIQILTSGSVNPVGNYDLQDGIANMVGSNSTASIESYGNGWYRCILQTNEVLAANFFINYVNSLAAPRYQSIASSDTIYLWGAQAEAGAYQTSYIPTTSASVTRNADAISQGNIFTNGLITASGGTWFIELKNNTAYTSDSNVGAIFLDTASFGYTNGFVLRKFTSTRIRIMSYASSVGTTLVATTTNTVKIAIKWNGTTADVFVNGVKEISATPFTTTNMQFLGNNTNPFLAYISSMALFPTPLTDDELEELTGEGFDTYELMAENLNYILQ